MLRILHYVLLSCLYKIYSNILYIASMNSNKIQGTVNAVILSISISIYKTLSQKKEKKKKRNTPKKKMEALWSRRHLTIYLPRFAESAAFSNDRKVGDGCGGRPYSPYPCTSARCQRPSAALILPFLAASATHGLKLALRYETFENRSQ